VEVRVRKEVGRLSTVAAECVIPRPQAEVWKVLTDYDHLVEMVPFLTESRVIGEEDGATLLAQAGRGGLWVFQRRFTVVFRIEETPTSHITFQAVRGDFRRFEGFWHLERRPEGTFVSHQVEVVPAFYVPRWAMRVVARHLMSRSLEGVIRRCLRESSSGEVSGMPVSCRRHQITWA
jgi:ribosome-associated toxin RatA of RatAB toxin-antitoxin module